MKKILDILKINFCLFLSIFYKKKYNDCWLIEERGIDARDNGYFFFEYLKEKHPEIKVFFCLEKKSPDYAKISKYENIVEPNSIKHGIVYFSTKFHISTHPFLCKPKWSGLDYLIRKNIIKLKAKEIFLQHGITKDYIPGLTYPNLKCDLFICGAKPEYDYISKEYGFPSNIVFYSGFCRFDNLFNNIDNPDNYILFMPTWRHYLSDITNEADFKSSIYYKNINSFINDKELQNFLQKFQLKLIFYPHIEIQKWINSFEHKSDNVVFATLSEFDVQKLLIGCRFLITDYSSVFFDVAYLRKPVIFYQFDYKDYRQNHYSEGYFDYNDSFGPVLSSKIDVVNNIKQIYKNGLNEKYMENIDKFFPLYDNKNCERIFKKIMELDYEK